ncbi:MAG: hypothetical protein IJ374_11405, partial [Lachnospiraceae bacterium]|nr:hypothetical protein [Lachnospiraceae bacterium]
MLEVIYKESGVEPPVETENNEILGENKKKDDIACSHDENVTDSATTNNSEKTKNVEERIRENGQATLGGA